MPPFAPVVADNHEGRAEGKTRESEVGSLDLPSSPTPRPLDSPGCGMGSLHFGQAHVKWGSCCSYGESISTDDTLISLMQEQDPQESHHLQSTGWGPRKAGGVGASLRAGQEERWDVPVQAVT